ncbi:MAG TPA: hypothetical protein VJU87_08190 [Gemmatimonadaceae bacterium]|nr:hypothetical protein [Gemmatimonadaceae bacterium]
MPAQFTRARESRTLVLLAAALALAPSMARAQRVLLQIRPHVGDTLHIRFEQETQLTRSKTSSGQPAPASMSTTIRMLSRAIVESSTASETIVRTITDSVQFSSSDASTRALGEESGRMLEGHSTRLRISPDGTMALAGDAESPREASQIVSAMPATLPSKAVEVGSTWTREMPLPGAGGVSVSGPTNGWLRARFRLDSVSSDGSRAYVSMRGEMSSEPSRADAVGPMLEKGSVTGSMLVDRKRGWLTESRFTVIAHSAVTPPGASAPMHFTTRITQKMETDEGR